MAISTYLTFLMVEGSTSGKYEKLVDIKDFPDLGAAPDMIDTTTLTDSQRTYIAGITGADGLEFTANYTLEDYKKLAALEHTSKNYAVWFGGTKTASAVTPTGTSGKFGFTGELSVFVTGGGVNEAVGLTITIAPSTPIEIME